MSNVDSCRRPKSVDLFRRACRTQLIVVGAILVREIHTRYGRENFGFIWIIIEPLLLGMAVVAFWVLWRSDLQQGIPVLIFAMTGYIPFMLWRQFLSRSIKCVSVNLGLLYHRQVRVLDLLYARFIIEMLGVVLAFWIAGFFFWSIDLYSLPRDLGLFYLGWFYLFFATLGAGLGLAALTERFDWSAKLTGPLIFMSYPLSGVFFLLDWLPERARTFLIWMPTVNAFEMIRGGQFGDVIRVHYDHGAALLTCSLLLLLGLVGCRRIHAHIHL